MYTVWALSNPCQPIDLKIYSHKQLISLPFHPSLSIYKFMIFDLDQMGKLKREIKIEEFFPQNCVDLFKKNSFEFFSIPETDFDDCRFHYTVFFFTEY